MRSPTIIARANALADKAARLATLLAGAGLFLMMLVGAVDIISGKLLGLPVPGAFEATESLLAASALLPLAYNRVSGAQIRVGFAVARLPLAWRAFLALLGDVLGAGLFAVLAWQGWKYAMRSLMVMEYQSGPVAFPVYPAKIILALALTLMALTCLARAIAPRKEAG
jgi:TRAP-type mannitol/chloroaromatic compound transport system permease small subunit